MLKKILCFFGFHKFKASLNDYIEQFGSIPLNGKIADKAICEYCGKKYKSNNK